MKEKKSIFDVFTKPVYKFKVDITMRKKDIEARKKWKQSKGVKKNIRTIQGEAKFVRTEEDDKHGNWHGDYQTGDGFWVIHDGKRHHIYKANKRSE